MENSISQDAGSGLSDYMLQKRIELIISINNKKVANEMENIRSTLSRLNDEIHQIRKGLDNNIVRPREEPSAGFTNAENTKSVLAGQKIPKRQSQDLGITSQKMLL